MLSQNINIPIHNTPYIPDVQQKLINQSPIQSLEIQQMSEKMTTEDQLKYIQQFSSGTVSSGLSDNEEFAVADQLQQNINLLKQQINEYESKRQSQTNQTQQVDTTILLSNITNLQHRTHIQSYLSNIGKLLTSLIVLWPLPVYLSVLCRSQKINKLEKMKQIESQSWRMMLLNVICNSIWISYSFKVQSIEIAIVNVFSMLIHIILLSIYLNVKPEQILIIQFFAVILICQMFNFDFFNQYSCAFLALCFGILLNIIPLSIIPNIIETRKTDGMNINQLYVSFVNSIIWIFWSIESSHYLYMLYFLASLSSQVVQILFYRWANHSRFSHHSQYGETLYLNSNISEQRSQRQNNVLINMMIPFFKQFIVRTKFNEMQNMFYDSQNTQQNAYLKQYSKYRQHQQERYEDDERDEEPYALDGDDNEWDGQAEDIEAIAQRNIDSSLNQPEEAEFSNININQSNVQLKLQEKCVNNNESENNVKHYYQEPEEESQTSHNNLNRANLKTLTRHNKNELETIDEYPQENEDTTNLTPNMIEQQIKPRFSASSFGSNMTFKTQNSYNTATSFRTAESFEDAHDQQIIDTTSHQIPNNDTKQELQDLKVKLEQIQSTRQKTD